MRDLRAAAAVMVLVAQIGCDEGGATDPPGVAASLELTPATVDTLFSVADTVQLSAVVRDGAGNPIAAAPVTFESSAPSVASVSGSGMVVSVGNGAAVVTARSGALSDALTVRVRQKLANVLLTAPRTRLAVGTNASLSAEPVDARGMAIAGLPGPTYASSDTTVVAVSAGGAMSGMGPGDATVTARVRSSADGTSAGTVDVTVVAALAGATVQMGATTFSPTSVDITRGGTVTFVNDSGILHDVDFGITAHNIPVHSSGRNTRAFPDPGMFPYHCNLHSGMTGTVFVH